MIQSVETVYGLAICRGDILEKDCKSCIVNAANEIRSHCPNNKVAIKWYYYYTLKYHNLDFFCQIDRDTLFFTNTPKNMNNNQLVRQNKGEWLAQLAGQASVNAQMFSTRDFDVGDNYKLHGSV
ncbi:cysteine-rich repeat secretory protein 38 [Quercus suber]|uniref:Cysteine-rich repeat secretory protein 38 n=1 Tax=Quercus suber TaxID=58331 RepID=A0AAW0L1P4_QUESU